MKTGSYTKTLVRTGIALLFAMFMSLGRVQASSLPASPGAVGSGNHQAASVLASTDASAMDKEVGREIAQAWAEHKDASGAAAFLENGEIALSEGRDQEAKEYFRKALDELARIGVVEHTAPAVSQACAVQARHTPMGD